MSKQTKVRSRIDRRLAGLILLVIAGCFVAAIEGVDALGIARAIALLIGAAGILYGIRLMMP